MSRARFEHVDTTMRALYKIRDKAAPLIADGLERCSQIVLRKSQTYVPVKFGYLKASGRTETNMKPGFGARSTVVYGNSQAWYAAIVHEVQAYMHAPPTCWKYLERAAREMRGTCTALMNRTFLEVTEIR